jgi:uncharacterized repeat protein (TIGR01451 family)
MSGCVRITLLSAALYASVVGVGSSLSRGDLHAQSASAASVPQVFHAVGFARSADVRDLPAALTSGLIAGEIDGEDEPLREVKNRQLPKGENEDHEQRTDAAVQAEAPSASLVSGTPDPTVSVDGLSSQDNADALGARVVPPDTVGDVGPNHYVQAVNLLVRVYDKTGAPLTQPRTMSSLFKPLGGICASNDNGDPIVLYDPLADRWLLSQFAFSAPQALAPPYHQCIAISQSADPAAAYYLYDFVLPNADFNDYPHFGVWSDGYYMTDNQFENGGPAVGDGLFAFDRAKMLAGDPTAAYIYVSMPKDAGMLPSDVDGLAPPPPGTPNYIAEFTSVLFGDPIDGMKIFEFHADFANPSASTVTPRAESPLPVAAFDPRKPTGRNVIEQPSPAGPTQYLDPIQDRLMFRLAYRNFGDHESLVVTHTVNVSGLSPVTASTHQAGVRYYELRRSGGAFAVQEQATFAPGSGNGATGDNRWMGSAAQDGQGNLAVGYSVSGTGPLSFPSLRYAARLATDPPNGLFQGERTLVAGSGVQRSTSGRWGDYSALVVDPVDDCTFWFTSEYYTEASEASSTAGWLTRIGNFRLPSCVTPARGTLEGIVTNASTGRAFPGAVVRLPDGVSRLTDAAGHYAFALGPGTYAAAATATNFSTDTAAGLIVTNGATTTRNFTLAPAGADLAVAVTAPAIVTAATDVTLTIDVTNSGPVTATDVVLSNPTPDHTAFVSAASTAGSCATPSAGGSGAVTCQIGSLTPGGSATLTLVVHGTAPDGFILDAATVGGAQTDQVVFNNSAKTTTAVTCGASFTIAGGPIGTAVTNGVQTGRIQRNGGPSDCLVPKAFPGVNTTVGARKYDLYNLQNDGDAPACVKVDISGTCDTNVFAVAYLGAFDPRNLAANYLADPGASGAVSFSFAVPGGATAALVMHEVNANPPGTPACTYKLQITGLPIACPIADVQLTGTAPATVTAGDSLTYAFTATNRGASPAAGVVVSHQVPPGTTFESIATPDGWTCTTPAIGSAGAISCSHASMAPGEIAAMATTVRVNCPLLNGRALTTSAALTSSTPDPNPFNNAATITTTVNNPPPTIAAPPAITVSTAAAATTCSRVVTDAELGSATGSASCGAVTVTRTGVPAGNDFPSGTTTLTYTATDAAGNTSTATQVVTVVDGTAPVISAVRVDKPVLWPPDGKLTDVVVNYTAIDNCGPVTTSLTVTSNEPAGRDGEDGSGNSGKGGGNRSGKGSGPNPVADFEVVDAHHVHLRAERNDDGPARIYTITINAVDQQGNASAATVLVRVPVDGKGGRGEQ